MKNIERKKTTIQKPKQIHELGDDFKFVKSLGSGSFGAIELFKYVGNDQKIIKMCNEKGEIGVKFQNIIDINEANIGTQLLNYAVSHPQKSQPFNLIMPYKKDDNIVAILTNPVFFEKSQNANLEDFIVKKLPLFKASSKKNPWSVAFSSGLAISLAQLANEMHRGQANLRKAKVLHLDTACRNFLVAPPKLDVNGNILKLNLLISDYGLSGKMDKNRTVNTEAIAAKAPLRFFDQRAVSERTATNSTDFFSLKTTFTEMSGFFAGAKDNTQTIKYPGYDILPGRFFDNAPYAEDKKALNIYLENVKAMLPQCPEEIRKEIELFITCYENYLINLDNPELNHKDKKSSNKEALLKCNDKFIEETLKLKNALLHELKTINYSQYNQLPDREIIIRRLLILDVTDDFKNSKTYESLTELHTQCQKLNEEHFEELFKKHTANINQLNNLDLPQRLAQTEIINKLLLLDIREKFRNNEKYQPFKEYQEKVQSSNNLFIVSELQSLNEIGINIDKIDKKTIESAINNITQLQKLSLSPEFFNTEPAQTLIKNNELFEKVLNEYNIKENLESILPPIANLKMLDEGILEKNALDVCHMLSLNVREQFLESDTYQSLLYYQKTIMLQHIEKRITNLMTKLEANTTFKDGQQSLFYNTQKKKYTEALANINNEFNDEKYLNLRQVQKILRPIDTVINNEIDKRVSEQKAIEKRLSDYLEFENSIKDELKQYKWIFFERDVKSKDPHVLAILQLKNKLDEYRDQIKKGEIKQLDPIKKSLNELRDDINSKLLEKQNKVTESKNTPSIDKPLPVQQNSKSIDNSNRKRF